jgi:hypothetical protein
VSANQRTVAALLIGSLLGAAVTQARDRALLHRLAEAQRLSQEDVVRLHTEAARLRQQLSVVSRLPRQGVIAQVVLTTLDSRVPLADVEAALEPVSSSLLGLPMTEAAPEVIWRLFNDRLITIRGRLYRTRVQVIVVAPVTRVQLELARLPART